VKKFRIKSDEVYPVYSLEEVCHPEYFPEEIVEIDEDFLKEFDETETKFYKMQNKMGKLLKARKLV